MREHREWCGTAAGLAAPAPAPLRTRQLRFVPAKQRNACEGTPTRRTQSGSGAPPQHSRMFEMPDARAPSRGHSISHDDLMKILCHPRRTQDRTQRRRLSRTASTAAEIPPGKWGNTVSLGPLPQGTRHRAKIFVTPAQAKIHWRCCRGSSPARGQSMPVRRRGGGFGALLRPHPSAPMPKTGAARFLRLPPPPESIRPCRARSGPRSRPCASDRTRC